MKKACKGGSAGEDEFEGGALKDQASLVDYNIWWILQKHGGDLYWSSCF